MIVTQGIFSGLLWGILVGMKMPWVDSGKLLPFRPIVFLEIYFLFILPNLLPSALFFTIGALTRSLSDRRHRPLQQADRLRSQ